MPKNRWDVIANIILLNDYKMIAEVGASRGDTARGIIRCLDSLNFRLNRYYLIDLPDNRKDFAYHFNPEFLKGRKEPRTIFKASLEAVEDFQDNSLDLVFLDADHSEAAFVPDIKAWMKKLRVGGTLCGDEYLAPPPHSCAYRTSILDRMFGEVHHQEETRLSEGYLTHMWWVKKRTHET